MLIKLKMWILNNTNRLKELGIQTDGITEGSYCLFVDQSTDNFLSRITIWDNGLLDSEILRIDSGSMIFYEHHEINEKTDLDNIFEKYVDTLASNSVH